jgi:tetratricopeptide (TPR) repeat protein
MLFCFAVGKVTGPRSPHPNNIITTNNLLDTENWLRIPKLCLGNATGKTSEAIIELKRALQLARNSDEGYRGLGKAYLALGQKEQALHAYQKAIDINPYYWVNYNSIGLAYSDLGEYDKALLPPRN